MENYDKSGIKPVNNQKSGVADQAGDAIEKLGKKISDAGAKDLGKKIHDLGDRIEKHHTDISHPAKDVDEH